jgi:hypothetical protein
MPDEIENSPQAPAAAGLQPQVIMPLPATAGPRAPRRPRFSTALLIMVLAFAVGVALTAWLATRSGARFERLLPGHQADAGTAAGLAATGTDGGSDSGLTPQSVGTLEGRVGVLEGRIDALDRQASAAAGNAGRAEALLVAFATRRAIERGAPLGYLEDQLKLRFGDALPNAVATVIGGARNPVTLDQLALGLDAISRQSAAATPSVSGWDRVRDELSGLFVIRRDQAPQPAPGLRLDQARFMLREGRTGDAITTVRATTGVPHAQDWIAAAERYQDLQRALDLLETTALLEPRELNDGKGHKIEQPSPLAAPAGPPASPAPAASAAATTAN